MSNLQELRDLLDEEVFPYELNPEWERVVNVKVVEAAEKYANIHPSRLHEWHILHVRAGSWGLTHPLDCDLTSCAYQDQAETWRDQPDELGNYRWEHEPVLESWERITEDE